MAETVDTNSFKNGMHIELDGKVWRIVEFQHVKPGKGGAFVRTKLKSLEAGELVVIDTGANVDGYVSDYTRTLATGELDGEMREAYDVVLAAQQAGLEAIRAGVAGVDADAAARGVIEESDFAGTFGHGLGHGLGLDVHESPRLSTESSDTLAAGNLVTVEPGVYLEGRFGIRIEDDVIVTEDGIENPVRFTKELVTVS